MFTTNFILDFQTISSIGPYLSMEQHIFTVVIDYRGSHWKCPENKNATEVNAQQKLWF